MDYFYDLFDAFAYFFILLSVPKHFSCIEKFRIFSHRSHTGLERHESELMTKHSFLDELSL